MATRWENYLSLFIWGVSHKFATVLFQHLKCYFPKGSLLSVKTTVSTTKPSSTEMTDKEVEKSVPKPSEWTRLVSDDPFSP